MSDVERLKSFWKTWGHVPTDAQQFERFRTRVAKVVGDTWDAFIKPSSSLQKRFALVSGMRLSDLSPIYAWSPLAPMISEAKTTLEILEALQFLLMTLEDCFNRNVLKSCCDELNEVFAISPNVSVHVVFHNGKATLCRGGAKLLDDAVVDSNLVWLAKYPKASKPFEDALRIYTAKDVNNYRNMLDSLRLALEQLLRAVLQNHKRLEKQKEDLLRWLSQHDAHPHIIGMYNDLLSGFADYQNDAVKHEEDKYTAADVEFVLYATGTFMRLIQRLDEGF